MAASVSCQNESLGLSSKYDSEKLVNLIREHEILWNIKHKKYFNSLARSLAFQKIAETMGPTWTEDQVESKWNSLKTSYRRKKRRQQASMRSGVGSKDVYHSSWCLFATMDGFLAPKFITEKGFSNLKSSAPLQSTSLDIEEYIDETQSVMNDGTDILEKDLALINKENEFNSVNLYTTFVSNNHLLNFNRTQQSNNKRKANEINELSGNKIFCQFVETALDQISDPKKLNEAKYEIHTTLINILRN